MSAKQSHRYAYQGSVVMAMETVERGMVPVCRINEQRMHLWPLERAIDVQSEKLEPLPMPYYGNQIPGAR
jgi:hypothetical protein